MMKSKKINKRSAIKIFGLGTILVPVGLFLQAFIVAYLNPSKTVTIDINKFGEANFEMWIIMPYLIILGLITVGLIFYDEYKQL